MTSQDSTPGSTPKFAFNASLRLKFVLFITFPVALIFIALQNYLTSTELNETGQRIEDDMLQSTRNVALQLEVRLNQLEALANANARFLEGKQTISADDLAALTRDTVEKTDEVFGASVAVTPRSLPGPRELVAPYSFRLPASIKTIDLGDPAIGHDYRDTEWWKQPMEQKMALWTLPYYDASAGNTLMTSYAVPFTTAGKVSGVARIDLALQDMFHTLGLPEKNGSMIVNGKGRYLYHNDAALILNASLPTSDQYLPEDVGNLLAQMALGDPGLVYLQRRDIDDKIWVAFAPIKSAG